MYSLSLTEQEPSQIDVTTAKIVSTIAARIVRASEILATTVAEGYDYTHNLKT
jgi:hypothetical protein